MVTITKNRKLLNRPRQLVLFDFEAKSVKILLVSIIRTSLSYFPVFFVKSMMLLSFLLIMEISLIKQIILANLLL